MPLLFPSPPVHDILKVNFKLTLGLVTIGYIPSKLNKILFQIPFYKLPFCDAGYLTILFLTTLDYPVSALRHNVDDDVLSEPLLECER